MTNEAIQRTSDEFEVRNFLAKLAHLSDEGDLDEIRRTSEGWKLARRSILRSE